jgi:hypothetical protein
VTDETRITDAPPASDPDALARIAADISARLDELRPLVEEVPRLEAALAALSGVEGSVRRRRG